MTAARKRRETDHLDLTDRESAVVNTAVERARAQQEVRSRAALVSIGIAVLIAIGGSTLGWVLVRQEGVNRTNEIQQSRAQVLMESCVETNRRNVDSLAKLDTITPRHPTAHQQQGIQSTKLLIAALVPFHGNCKAYAQERLKP